MAAVEAGLLKVDVETRSVADAYILAYWFKRYRLTVSDVKPGAYRLRLLWQPPLPARPPVSGRSGHPDHGTVEPRRPGDDGPNQSMISTAPLTTADRVEIVTFAERSIWPR